MKKLQAFRNDPAVKEKYLRRLRGHYEADEIIHGTYWQNGKGCAVGCTIHSGQHGEYEPLLGIPQQLAHLEDGIFESLPNGQAKEWPIQFLQAIPVGADLRFPYWRFMHWLLADPKDGVIRFARSEKSEAAIVAVAGLFQRQLGGGHVPEEEWTDAAAASAAAASYAYAAAYAAARQKARIRQSEKLLELLSGATER